MSNQQTLLAQLNQRFPGADFEVDSTGNGSLAIFWETASPSNEQVAGLLRSAGLLASSNPNVPGYVKVTTPQTAQGNRPSPPPQPNNQPPPQRAAQNPQNDRSLGHKAAVSFGAQGLWSVSDLEVLRVTAERWVRSLQTKSTISYYTGGMSLLIAASGYLAWVLDIRPSLIFGQHLATQLASEWISLQLLSAVIFLLSITPNLLEFFASGLAAHGNLIVDIAIKAALIFDAATDAPMAFSLSKAFVGYFVAESATASQIASVILAMPVLLLSTVVVEIMFLSFVIAFVLLIRRWFEVGQTPQRRYVR